MRPKFKTTDILLLSSEPDHVLALRPYPKIEADIRSKLGISAPPIEHLERMAETGRLQQHERGGLVYFGPTIEGIAKYFSETRKVRHLLQIAQPFKSTPIQELAHWFDDYFQPGSEMGKRIAEMGLPGVVWPSGGTKWRTAEALFQRWNYPILCNYLSAFLVEMLDPQHWAVEGHEHRPPEKRAPAIDALNGMFKAAGLRVHEDGYLVPLLHAPEKKVATDVWDDEARFRVEVVQPLLERIPGVSQVILTHGPDEYGRDFLFWYRHPVSGERRWVGVQVKAGDVSGAVGRHVSGLVEQVGMTFQHPVKDVAAMGEVYVAEAMVLISGRFTSNAKERILASIKDPAWRANVSFMDRPDIERLIRTTRRD